MSYTTIEEAKAQAEERARSHNPAAFPSEKSNGMTLRDYFAAKAMQGIFASGNLPNSVTDEKLAATAYEVADAMLKAREQ